MILIYPLFPQISMKQSQNEQRIKRIHSFERNSLISSKLSSPPHLISSKDSCYSNMETRIKTSTFQPTDTGGTRTWRLQAGSQPPRVTEEMPSSSQTERTSLNDKKNEQTTEEKPHHCCDGQTFWQMVSGLWHTPYSCYSWNGMLGLMQVHKKHGQKTHMCTPHLAFRGSVVICSMKSMPH